MSTEDVMNMFQQNGTQEGIDLAGLDPSIVQQLIQLKQPQDAQGKYLFLVLGFCQFVGCWLFFMALYERVKLFIWLIMVVSVTTYSLSVYIFQ